MTKKLIVLNNKSNFTKEEFITYKNNLSKITSSNSLVLAPSMCYLSLFNLENFSLGSQNVSSYSEGSYTGEVASEQLKSLGVEYCLVGHKERRNYNHEESKEINKKIKKLLENNITPIICIGENEDKENQEQLLISMLRSSLNEISEELISKIIIAYEPLSSVGKDQIPSKKHLESVIKCLKNNYPNNKILYGGGITESNISILEEIKDLNGYLLGNLGLNIDKFKLFLQIIEK